MEYWELKKILSRLFYKGRSGFCKTEQISDKNGNLIGIDLKVFIRITDRTSGQKNSLWKRYVILKEELERMNKTLLLHRVRDLLILLETHEVDEQLLYGKTRIFDPHVLPKGTDTKLEKAREAKKTERMRRDIVRALQNLSPEK